MKLDGSYKIFSSLKVLSKKFCFHRNTFSKRRDGNTIFLGFPKCERAGLHPEKKMTCGSDLKLLDFPVDLSLPIENGHISV